DAQTSTAGDHSGILTLDSGGAVKLDAGSQILGVDNGLQVPTLDNVDNTITAVGATTIGGSGQLLKLQNDVGGTIDASGAAIVFSTGNTIVNAGLLEATGGGTLDVKDGEIHNTGTGPSKGIVIDGSSFLEVDIAGGGTLSLTGSGTVTLALG